MKKLGGQVPKLQLLRLAWTSRTGLLTFKLDTQFFKRVVVENAKIFVLNGGNLVVWLFHLLDVVELGGKLIPPPTELPFSN